MNTIRETNGLDPRSVLIWVQTQGSKIALVPSYLRVPQAAGQVKMLIFLVKIKNIPIYANNFCDTGRVPIFRYFKACKLLANLRISADGKSCCQQGKCYSLFKACMQDFTFMMNYEASSHS